MSIVVRDMEMPETCAECPLGEYEDAIYFHCALMEFSYIHKAESDRLDNCPLFEVQEPCEDAVKTITEASFTGKDGLDYVETLVALNALKMRKTGEWIDGLKCSNCGQVDTTKPNFCSACGSDMRGDPDD